MLTARVVPCLDVTGGRVVKGVRFQELRDSGDPAELAAMYSDSGADEIVVLDVSATNERRRTAADTVRRVHSAINVPLTVGGGIDSEGAAARLLDAGADKVAVNSAALAEPALIERLARQFGSQCVVLAVDAQRIGKGWRPLARSGSEPVERDAAEWCHEGESRGAGEILLTSWDQDGTGQGYDLALIRSVSSRVQCPIVASGGAAGVADMAEALEAGADAVLAATVFHDGHTTPADVKQGLARAGCRVRL